MSAPIRVLIADDESSARRRLLQFLAAEPDVQVVGECSNGLETCLEIARLAPDLLFLDVEMPERTGLEVLAQIGAGRMPATIFATAYDHYALPAFDANALDYLLKPFDQARFSRAMHHARRWIRMGRLDECQAGLAGVLEQLGASAKPGERILVRSGESQQLLNTKDILYIAAEGNYIRLHTMEGSHQMRERMVGIIERLDGARFRRIHRSHIVNLDHVKKLLPWFGGDFLVMMADGARLTLSRNFREALSDFA